MNKFYIIFILLFFIIIINCDDSGNNVIGAKDHHIKGITNATGIYADGISTTNIIATVTDNDGELADSMKVVFITEDYGQFIDNTGTVNISGNGTRAEIISDINGNAKVKLLSEASAVDLRAHIKVTVTAEKINSLPKNSANNYSISLQVVDSNNVILKTNNLKKQTDLQASTKSTEILFLGLTLTATIGDTILSADGLSQTKIEIDLKETTSENPVVDSKINIKKKYGIISKISKTDDQGKTNVDLTSIQANKKDTITVEFGKLEKVLHINYVIPKLEITSKASQAPADGESSIEIIATLVTYKNTSVPNAIIKFTTSSGRISESTKTNSSGQAIVNLITNNKSNPNVEVTATYLSLFDTTYVSFVDYNVNKLIVAENDIELFRDGIASKQITIQAVDELKRAVSNAEILLSTDMGNIPEKIITDDFGLTSFEYVTDAGITDTTATITASIGQIKTTIPIKLLGIELNLSANPLSIPADGQTISKIQAEVKYSKNHVGIPNYKVTFAVDNGTISAYIHTDYRGVAIVDYIAHNIPGTATITANCGKISKSTTINLSGELTNRLTFADSSISILRDGVSSTKIDIWAKNELNQPLGDIVIDLSSQIGDVPSSITTNLSGHAEFTYYTDSETIDAQDIITASYGNLQTNLTIDLLGINISITANPDTLAADGLSISQIKVSLKQTTSHIAIPDYKLKFNTDNGIIQSEKTTDPSGVAIVHYTSGIIPGNTTISVVCGELYKSTKIYLFNNYPSTINLEATPNFIWVKESGNEEQTTISATVLGYNGQPVTGDINVKFYITSGPNGGEYIEPSSSSAWESEIVKTLNGVAVANIRAGIRSGTVQIKAELVDFPEVTAKTTNIIIRSGPAYMWIDPSNPNNVIPHTTITVEEGKANTAFGNPVQEIEIGGFFGDIYNNPVEEGTAVYFTTTGGIITTDALTDENGRVGVILHNVNPFPYLQTNDNNQLTARNIPNPNDENIMLDYPAINFNNWDYEGDKIVNSIGTTRENDGIAVILAYTWGVDQNGNPIKVWATLPLIFSNMFQVFTVDISKSELNVGENATITIIAYDNNGNPLAAGTRIMVSTTAGQLSVSDLISDTFKYGYGKTSYTTRIVNSLKPGKDFATDAIITVKLHSAYGTFRRDVSIHLKID